MAQLLFTTEFTSKIHDIDAAGVMFFARYFYYAHDAYEQYTSLQNTNISKLIDSGIIIPIAHSEADYKSSIKLNEKIWIKVFLKEQGKHSFTLEYQFNDKSNSLKAVLKTVHVCLSVNDKKPKVLPNNFFTKYPKV